MEDLGSGCLVDPGTPGPARDPLVADVLSTGIDLVTFSGDKLLGGPQAGILLGRRGVLERIQRHPLNRVLRIDKLTLAALEATLSLYRDPWRSRTRIPTLAMLSLPAGTLRNRAQRLARRLKEILPPSFSVSVSPVTGRTGGGAMPMDPVPGVGVRLSCTDLPADEILSRLRRASPPVIARIEQDEVILDVRTLRKGEDRLVAQAMQIFSSC
jgi:L-seryl-tRNA(Ser) seleniumtransferase